jgi:hypothetical protein
MATELSRTLKAITKEPTVYEVWLKGEDRRSRAFTAAAKFDLNDPVENLVFRTYDFCSNYGTHGHKTSAVYLEDTIMGKEPTLEGVSMVATQWFISCVPMHRLCLRSCTDVASDTYFELDLALSVLEAKLLERIVNDPFFKKAV